MLQKIDKQINRGFKLPVRKGVSVVRVVDGVADVGGQSLVAATLEERRLSMSQRVIRGAVFDVLVAGLDARYPHLPLKRAIELYVVVNRGDPKSMVVRLSGGNGRKGVWCGNPSCRHAQTGVAKDNDQDVIRPFKVRPNNVFGMRRNDELGQLRPAMREQALVERENFLLPFGVHAQLRLVNKDDSAVEVPAVTKELSPAKHHLFLACAQIINGDINAVFAKDDPLFIGVVVVHAFEGQAVEEPVERRTEPTYPRARLEIGIRDVSLFPTKLEEIRAVLGFNIDEELLYGCVVVVSVVDVLAIVKLLRRRRLDRLSRESGTGARVHTAIAAQVKRVSIDSPGLVVAV